ncbi:hypothetical protein [Streptomyces sp. NBC_00063]|uniref:hypothetical protein n=1 Tax=Streptomyces sp. NBC_00063 TaxID=2975638 RepID=UPI003D733431
MSARPLGDATAQLMHFTDDILIGEVRKRLDLAAHDGLLITVATLATSSGTEQLRHAKATVPAMPN